MSKTNRTYCAVSGCLSNTIMFPDYSFFSVPRRQDLRQRWLQLICRTDLISGTRFHHHRVCEQHFHPDDILMKATRRLLKKNVLPSLNLPVVVLNHDAAYFPAAQIEETEDIKEIKQEMDDCFSEHEEEITEAVERRKRKSEAEPLAGFSKAIKVEDPEEITIEFELHPKFHETTLEYNTVGFSNSQISTKELPKAIDTSSLTKPKEALTVQVNTDNDVFPVDFMKSVLNSQEEILKVLKSQILLENPNPELLTFLRLVGAKLSRLDPATRREAQKIILDII